MSAGAKRRRGHLQFFKGRSQCLSKIQHQSEESAQQHVEELKGFARYYACPLCKMFHVTSAPRSRSAHSGSTSSK